MINWILKILALLQNVSVLGYSRDGPLGTLDLATIKPIEIAGDSSKAHGLGLCLL